VARLRIGELLVEARVISQAQLDEALAARATRGDAQKLGAYLVEQGLVSEAQLTQILSQQLSVPWVSLYHIDFSRELLNRVPKELAERFSAVPIFVRHVKKQGNSLYVAMDDPTNEAALEEIGKAAGLPVKPMIACITDIRNAIRVYYADSSEPGMRELGSAPGAPGAPVAVPPRTPPAPPTMRERSVAEKPPPPAPRAPGPPPAAGQPPPAPIVGRAPLATVVDAMEILSDEAISPMHGSHDSPDAEPELEVREYVPKPRAGRPRMVSLTLLDGSTLNVPSRGSSPGPASERSSALAAAAAHGADATEVLGQTDWQAMFAALLSLMLKKNLISDWEFVEELRNI
jgi:type IV pilus assembly protein PilB